MFKNYNFFKKIKILFDGSNLKSLILIFIGIIFMGFFEILGVFSIAPFMAVILDPDIVLNNRYFSYVYNIKDFGGKNDFVIFLGIAVVVFLIAYRIIGSILYQIERLIKATICKKYVKKTESNSMRNIYSDQLEV